VEPILYIDLASPYAYLAAERAAAVLGVEPRLEVVLVGAIFGWRGRGSWALTDQRAPGMAEIERRAADYGLPPLVWPAHWPANSLHASRAALWAEGRGALVPFVHAVFHRQFAAGADIQDHDVLRAAAQDAGLPPEEIDAATGDAALKASLKQRTEAAWAAGVPGVPTTMVGGEPFFGDDRLPDAAAARR
jgi:2-hydroxychromene-2-carboxylate isomerase